MIYNKRMKSFKIKVRKKYRENFLDWFRSVNKSYSLSINKEETFYFIQFHHRISRISNLTSSEDYKDYKRSNLPEMFWDKEVKRPTDHIRHDIPKVEPGLWGAIDNIDHEIESYPLNNMIAEMPPYCTYEELEYLRSKQEEFERNVGNYTKTKPMEEEKRHRLKEDICIQYKKDTFILQKKTSCYFHCQVNGERMYQVSFQSNGNTLFEYIPEKHVEEFKEPLLSDIVKFGDELVKDGGDYKFAGKYLMDGQMLLFDFSYLGVIKYSIDNFNKYFKLKK